MKRDQCYEHCTLLASAHAAASSCHASACRTAGAAAAVDAQAAHVGTLAEAVGPAAEAVLEHHDLSAQRQGAQPGRPPVAAAADTRGHALARAPLHLRAIDRLIDGKHQPPSASAAVACKPPVAAG
jgi:hypothetical protein